MLNWIRTTFFHMGHPIDLPPDSGAVRLLFEKNLAKMSWFDNLSSSWYEQSIVKKTGYVASVVPILGIISFVSGVPLLGWLLLVPIGIVIHQLLITHEKNRREAALYAAISAQQVQEEKEALSGASESLQQTTAHLVESNTQDAARLNADAQSLRTQAGTLTTITQNVQSDIQAQSHSQQQLAHSAQGVTHALQNLTHTITAADSSVLQVANVTTNVSSAADNIREGQKKYTESVKKLGLFADRDRSLMQETFETPTEDRVDGAITEIETALVFFGGV